MALLHHRGHPGKLSAYKLPEILPLRGSRSSKSNPFPEAQRKAGRYHPQHTTMGRFPDLIEHILFLNVCDFVCIRYSTGSYRNRDQSLQSIVSHFGFNLWSSGRPAPRCHISHHAGWTERSSSPWVHFMEQMRATQHYYPPSLHVQLSQSPSSPQISSAASSNQTAGIFMGSVYIPFSPHTKRCI